MSIYHKIPTFATPEDSVDHPFPIETSDLPEVVELDDGKIHRTPRYFMGKKTSKNHGFLMFP